jgi:hypothetical protein
VAELLLQFLFEPTIDPRVAAGFRGHCVVDHDTGTRRPVCLSIPALDLLSIAGLAGVERGPDNPDDVELTLRAFQKNNLRGEIAIARDGQEALDYLAAACANAGR